MRVLGIDQSLAKAAFIQMEGGDIKKVSLSKTGKSTVKTKRKDTTYYKSLYEQVHHVCLELEEQVASFKPDYIVFESLSFGSVGSSTRDLAVLFGGLRETLTRLGYGEEVLEYAPTSLKSYARDFLKPERQVDGVLKTGKPKKVKMDKKLMVEAVREIYGEDYLKGYNYSSGLDDLADATLLAHKVYYEKKD